MGNIKVPFVDLYSIHKPLEKKFLSEFTRVLHSNSFVAGKDTEKFEKSFAQFCGGKYALLVNNGTSALYAALMALNLPPGSEAIIPANTFIATAEAAVLANLKPVFVDADPQSLLMDLEHLEKRITKKTSVIIPVHLYGRLVDIQAVKRILSRKGRTDIKILEDACQAHGASWNGKQQVSGHAAAYSFYPGKNLGALGEAGAIVTNSKSLDSHMRLFRNHGSRIRYHHDIIGSNLRASELEAVFLGLKLPSLARYNAHRVKVAGWYENGLKSIEPVRIFPTITDGSHVYHLYLIEATRRKQLQAYLAEQGIETGIHYPVPLHLQPAFATLGIRKGTFPVSEASAERILSLPMFATITKEQVHYVCETIRAFYQKK